MLCCHFELTNETAISQRNPFLPRTVSIREGCCLITTYEKSCVHVCIDSLGLVNTIQWPFLEACVFESGSLSLFAVKLFVSHHRR